MLTQETASRRSPVLVGELAKLPAFARRDLLTLLSYRFAIAGDWVNLVVQLFIFAHVSKLVSDSALPQYGGDTNYLAFVSVGIAISTFLQLGLGRSASALRSEQMLGTLESLFVTPTSPTTVQFGAGAYDSIYVPVRTAVFLGAVAIFFDVPFQASGILPTLALLSVFIPFVWGLAAVSAASLLTLRRGGGFVGFGAGLLGVTSGAYFPTSLFPDWLQVVVDNNPIAIVLEACRTQLLGGFALSSLLEALVILAPYAVLSLVLGFIALRAALRRERRLGTLGLY